MKSNKKISKAVAVILTVICIIGVSAVTSFALDETQQTETTVTMEKLGGKYGNIIPSDKALKETKKEFNFYGDSATLYFKITSKGEKSAYCAVEIYSDSSYSEESAVTDYRTSLGKSGTRSLSIDWKFKKIRSGIYYGKSYIYTEADGKKTVDTSTVKKFTVTVERIGKKTVTINSLKNGNGFVTVSWKELPNATRYRIYRKDSGDKSWTNLATVKSGTLSYNDTTVKPEKTYIYTVKAFDGSYASLYNKTGLSTLYIPCAPLITGTNAGSDGITIKWSKAQNADKYILYYSADGCWKKIATTTATSHNDTSVPKNSKRTYRVCSVTKSGTKKYSESITAKRLNNPSVSFYSSDKKIILKWSAVPDAEKYRIFSMVNGSWKKVAETDKNSYSLKASSGKDVMYTVRCISNNSKNFQSYYTPYSGRYTDFTFRKKNLNMAGCGSFGKTGGLSLAQQEAVFRYMNAYYSSIGSFKKTVSGIFTTAALRDRESTIWNTTIAVRSRAIEDLSLTRFKYTLTVKDLKKLSATSVKFTVFENVNQKFRDIPVLSQSYQNEYWFTISKNKDGKWLVSKHDGDCSPFYNFQYDKKTKTDLNLSKTLKFITERQATVGVKNGKNPSCNHPYDRTAAKNYMMQWLDKRNPAYFAYDAYGGNCMNFASQVLYAGGIHKTKGWYWNGDWDCSSSWIAVGSFTDYAEKATKKQLYCKCNDNYYAGNICDLVLIGVDSPRSHATVISDIIRNEKGQTIDYLLCCNTTNLKNFPASAYHYTNQHLIRIYGWND